MELMLRIFTGKNLAAAALIAATLALAARYLEYPVAAFKRWRYPPQASAGPLGREISSALEAGQRRRLDAAHGRVAALLAASSAEGFDVAALQARAREALLLEARQGRAAAFEALARLEMDIPRKKVQYIPMSPVERDRASTESPRPPSAPGRGKKHRARR